MDLEVWLKRCLCSFVWLRGFPLPTIGNVRDRWGGGLACHGEPFDMLLWKIWILEQIKCLKDSAMNDSANHQIPFLCNISQRSELVSTYYISRLVIFKLFQSHSKLLMPNNVHILISPWLLVATPIVSHPALASQLVMQWRSCPGTGDQEADGAPWGSTRVIRWVNEACGLDKDPPPSPWRHHKTHELICFKDHDW